MSLDNIEEDENITKYGQIVGKGSFTVTLLGEDKPVAEGDLSISHSTGTKYRIKVHGDEFVEKQRVAQYIQEKLDKVEESEASKYLVD